MNAPGVFAAGDRVRIIADTGDWVYPESYAGLDGIAVSVQQFKKYRRWLVDYGESGCYGRHQIREEHLERSPDAARIVVPQPVLATASLAAAPAFRPMVKAQLMQLPWGQGSLWDVTPDPEPTLKAATRVATKTAPVVSFDASRILAAATLPDDVSLAGAKPRGEDGPEILVVLDDRGALYHKAYAAYSGDMHDGADAGRIRCPVVILGSSWVCNIGGGGAPWSIVPTKTPEPEQREYSFCHLVEVIPLAHYKGPTVSPKEWYAEAEAHTRKRGDLRGLRVKHGKATYVCTDAELYVGYRHIVAEAGAPREPVKANLEVKTTNQAHPLIELLRRWPIASIYSFNASASKLVSHADALWIYRGASYSPVASRNTGEPHEQFYCDEVVPLTSWQGPTRQGDQHIRGDYPGRTSKRGIVLRCDADSGQYVMTGRTLTVSYRPKPEPKAT